MSVDQAKVRRESMRWQILFYLNQARPHTTHEDYLLATLRVIFGGDVTPVELRRELDYLADRDLVELRREPSGTWFADLTRWGVDIAEYTVECDPGIGRPAKYWIVG